ncbi:MAG: BON domain-containing protein [Acidobacteria bacterium]|nr:BON domain-containing protein [Acidobacteriota bacterium]
MSSKTLLTLLAGATLSLSAAACNPADNTNTNTNANANANRAANANATATPTATPASTGGVYNRNYNSRDDYKKDETSYRDEAKKAGETIGSGLEDGWIHLKVRAALAAVDDLKDLGINVDVDNNVVTLRGSVPTAAEKTKAQDAARKVDGVKSVTNKLEVKPDGSASKSGDANSGAANTNKK